MPRPSCPSLLAALLFAGCGAAPDKADPVRVVGADFDRGLTTVVRQPAPRFDDLGPQILLPAPSAKDDEVARVGDRVLRKSHVFTRLTAADPQLAASAIDLLVFDVLVAEHAMQHGIRVDPAKVEVLLTTEEEALRKQIGEEFGSAVKFDDYIRRVFGMELEDWRQTTRLRVAQRFYHGYVIRYLALLEDRVQVRYISNKDPEVLVTVQEKVGEGADFGTLALQHSQDEFSRAGGLLPPFGANFPHPITEQSVALQPGQLSPIFEVEVGGSKRHYLVYCLKRMPRREVTFEEVRAELDEELEKKPLGKVEMDAYTLRYRGELEAQERPGGDGHDTERRSR